MAEEKLCYFVLILYLDKITCLVLFWLNNEIKQGFKGGIGIEENSEGYTPDLSKESLGSLQKKIMSLSPENIDVCVAISVNKLMFCRPESESKRIFKPLKIPS